MKKIILILILMLTTATNVFAAKLPDNIKGAVKKDFAKADFRFDGLITMPDGTMYLPLYPALVKKPEKIEVAKTVPENRKLTDLPDIVIFNNDFTLLKIITDSKGRKTVLSLKEPPLEVRTGLLPQDILVPSGLIIPENIKGIIGNLQIPTAADAGLKIKPETVMEYRKTPQTSSITTAKIPQLQNKTFYIATCYSKNIQVVKGENANAEYALAQKTIPYDIKGTPDEKFLFVTTFGKTYVDVISLVDDRVIKQIDLTTTAEEIVMDKINNKAYISSPDDSSIYIIDLNTMTLKQKIKVKGACTKLSLSDDGTKLFYNDKKLNNIWVIELDNEYVIKNIGSFANVSRILFAQGKVYALSRTKNRLAVIDYATMSPIKEMDVDSKPVDMIFYKDKIFILSAQYSTVQVIDAIIDEPIKKIELNTNGFSTLICPIKSSPLAIVTDTKVDRYSVIDLDKNQLVKVNTLQVPVSKIVVVSTIQKPTAKAQTKMQTKVQTKK